MIRRIWWVLLGGGIVTLGLVNLTLHLVPLTYDVTASVVLLPPITSVEANGNPFLDLGGLDVVAGVLATAITDSESTENVAPAGSGASYTVQKDASVSGSVLQVAVTDTSPDAAFSTLDAVLTLAKDRLEELQVSVSAPAEDHVQLMVITNNVIAEPNTSSLIRTLIIVLAAGLAATVALAVAVYYPLRRRDSLSDETIDAPVGAERVPADLDESAEPAGPPASTETGDTATRVPVRR
ncbi:hypothetical protein BJQ94_16465 [Cryobacterium sp. SO2]|uniref:hypothetical protein n=1 Tax=Cryobacterium sp. SO2 TaxID=1897060 RepID=UPI00223DAE7D|nr:hypothetical protein [Cryobacterium sp. SO2]WEO76929.1 hypothetical protein BJQ94_16465 [Cryobacterium sp. SO2]